MRIWLATLFVSGRANASLGLVLRLLLLLFMFCSWGVRHMSCALPDRPLNNQLSGRIPRTDCAGSPRTMRRQRDPEHGPRLSCTVLVEKVRVGALQLQCVICVAARFVLRNIPCEP